MRRLLGGLAIKGCNLRLILTFIQAYIHNSRSFSDARKARGRDFRSVVNRDLNRIGRDGSLPPEFARAARAWLLARAEVAFDAKRMGMAHDVVSLAMLEYYIETKTGKRPTAYDLVLLSRSG